MIKYMRIVDDMEGREWCSLNGYRYLGTRIHPEYGFVMEYEDGVSESMSKKMVGCNILFIYVMQKNIVNQTLKEQLL